MREAKNNFHNLCHLFLACGEYVHGLWRNAGIADAVSHSIKTHCLGLGKRRRIVHFFYPDFTQVFTQILSHKLSVILNFCPSSTYPTIKPANFINNFFINNTEAICVKIFSNSAGLRLKESNI